MDKCPDCGQEYEVKMTPKMTEWYHRQTCTAIDDDERKKRAAADAKHLEAWLNAKELVKADN